MLAHGAGEVGYLLGPLGAIWHIVNEGEGAGAGGEVVANERTINRTMLRGQGQDWTQIGRWLWTSGSY